jgi:hypothetical protein
MSAAERYREALEKGDLEAMLAGLAPDVRLHSPITPRYTFEGAEDVGDLLRVIFHELGVQDVEVRSFLEDERSASLFHRAVVGGVPIEEATLLTIDRSERIAEIRLYIRPLPALTGLMARLGPRLARQRGGRAKTAVTGAMGAPLAALTRSGDRLVPWLLRGSRR